MHRSHMICHKKIEETTVSHYSFFFLFFFCMLILLLFATTQLQGLRSLKQKKDKTLSDMVWQPGPKCSLCFTITSAVGFFLLLLVGINSKSDSFEFEMDGDAAVVRNNCYYAAIVFAFSFVLCGLQNWRLGKIRK